MSMSDLEPETSAAQESAWAAWHAGCCPIPIKDDGSKKPPIRWQDYEYRMPTEVEMRRWFGPHRAAAVVCGKVSGGLIMLEMEGPDYERGLWATFRAAAVEALGERRWQEITAVVEMSPSGGPHLMFRCTETIVGNLKLARRKVGPKEVETIMETRGQGGYTVIAGSVGHASGKPWTAAKGTWDDIPTVTAEELHIILDAARTLDEMPPPPIRLSSSTPERPRIRTGDSVFDAVVDDYNRRHTWDHALFGAFEFAYERGHVTYWHRIGSDNETGATTNGTGRDTLIVFSSSTPFDSYGGQELAPSYDRFGAYAVLHHGGDRTAAMRALRDKGYGKTDRMPPATPSPAIPLEDADATPVESETEELDEADHLPVPIDWDAFWKREAPDEDWLCEPLLARGRQTALFAAAKVGKSLLMLEVAAALATGRPALSHAGGEPIDVVYADYEMTEDDLYERLESLGYGPHDDLSHLHYYLLPTLAPLNTDVGGQDFVTICERHNAQAAVIDTFGRALEGEENANDTYLEFYRYCGLRLKQRGIALARLDHAGKDAAKGQRGGSAKDGDVDIVWSLEPMQDGLRMRRARARMSWVPERVSLRRTGDGRLRHLVVESATYLVGTQAMVELLERLDIPMSSSSRSAAKALREAGETGADGVIRSAQKFRKNHASEFAPPRSETA